MIRMVTKKPHDYAGRQLHEGDEFDCEEAHVQLMIALGRAEVLEQIAEPHNGAIIEPALIRSASQRAILKRKAS